MLSPFLTFLLFCTALSADTFTAGLSYGSSGVRVPALSKLILSLVSGLMFTCSVFFSGFLLQHFPERAALLLSFLILLLLSLYKGFDAFTADSLSRKINHTEPSLLSAREALLLALVLSLDSLSAGAGYELMIFSPVMVFLLSSLIHLLSLILGLSLSKRLFHHGSFLLSLLPALFFLLLALSRLLRLLKG